MASYSVRINDITQDDEFYVWGSGQDIRKFTGNSWEYYNYQNSAVPNGSPYFLDTRSIDMDPDQNVWVGCAQGPTAGLNEVAVFYINSKNVKEGKSWDFSILGTFDRPQEISFVYACPFGDDVYAFSTPLNGIGGTGTTGYTEYNGVTGGRFFAYFKDTDYWYEVAPDYTWPHVYDMVAQGYDGKTYFYYVATSEGLYLIPQGELETLTLMGGQKIIKQGQIFNTSTSGILSNYIYSIDLDENGNLWIGTANGLSYFDGKNFYNYPVDSGPVTKVKSRPNGHVFYAIGDGELNQGTGLWHFNGVAHTQYNSSNSSLNNNNVLDLELIGHNINQNGLTVYENSLWVLCYNDLVSFNYDQPHVYASSKEAGATGWNFTYFTGTGGTAAPLPKVNKYTWTYPEWQVYETEYLAYKFPGLDPRNLFLTTTLEAIADGRAGKQPYWNNWPIPTYDQEVQREKITEPAWQYGITASILSGLTGGVYLTCSDSITTKDGTKYYVGGYFIGNVIAYFGHYDDSTLAVLESINPTIGGRLLNGLSGASSYDNGETGFIVCYSEGGFVDSILPIRGYQTRVQSISHSPDGDFLYASGIYNRYVESGPYVWDSYEGENALRGGPTGAPAGFTTINVPGLTSGLYPWAYGTSGPILTSTWNYVAGNLGFSSGEFDVTWKYGSVQNWENVEHIYISYFDSLSVNNSAFLQSMISSSVISFDNGAGSTGNYRIDGTVSLGVTPVLQFDVSWVSGASGPFFSSPTLSNFDFYETLDSSYPLVHGAIETAKYWNSNDLIANGFWVAKIDKDLGSSSSFANFGVAEKFDYSVRTRFRISDFRVFPARYLQSINYGDEKESKISVTDYSVNVGLESTLYFPIGGGNGELATWTGLWDRVTDYPVPPYFLGSTTEISQNWSSDTVLGYLNLSTNNLSLTYTTTSESIFPGTGASSSMKFLNSVNSIINGSTTLLTGMSEKDFNFGGIGFTGATSGYTPFYAILDNHGEGITGEFVNGITGWQDMIQGATDEDTYYVTTVFGGSGTYFGKEYEASTTGAHFYTAQITEQGVPIDLFVDYVPLPSKSVSPLYVRPTDGDLFFISFAIDSGATAAKLGMLKSNRDGKICDYQYLTSDFYNADTDSYNFQPQADVVSNIFISAFNYGPTASGFINVDPQEGTAALSLQYEPELGINLGNIISRPGSGAWTWCDVHATDKGMQIPLMSTVFFSNYASEIYGKENNIWTLSDGNTGQELLKIKWSPYFIYTFTKPGNYTISNSVEDSMGNTYAITKPGYIEVVDHKVKRPDDKNPDLVDSFDYGVPDAFPGRDYQVAQLAKTLAEQQAEFIKKNAIPFGVEIEIPNDPDATFRNP